MISYDRIPLKGGEAYKAVFTHLRDLREEADKTQAELAAYLGATGSTKGNMKKENVS